MGSVQHRGVAVLLSIRPQYVRKILTGEKRVEFRRRPFGQPIQHVVIYETAPVGKIVAFFEVDRLHESTPRQLWRRFSSVGGIDRAAFDEYYANTDYAVAIGIRRVWELAAPLTLTDLAPELTPPQSYTYLSPEKLDQLALCVDPPVQIKRPASLSQRELWPQSK